jgi:hypothetical protein
MAMTIFFLLNGMGVIFLLYVLANFWQEGRRQENTTRRRAAEYAGRNATDVLIVTHPISHSAYGGVSVIPMQVRDGSQSSMEEEYLRFADAVETHEMSLKMKRFSTR